MRSPWTAFRLQASWLACLLFTCAVVPVFSLPAKFIFVGQSTPIGTRSDDGMLLAYPRGQTPTIASSSTFLIGAAPPGAQVTCNGLPVRVNASGYFAHVVKLSPGLNRFKIRRTGGGAGLDITVKRPPPPSPLAASPLKALNDTAAPLEDLAVAGGDIIQFALRAAPGATVSVTVGKRTIQLVPSAASKGSVNLGRQTAFGVSYQRSPASLRDLYSAFFKVPAGEPWKAIRPVYTVRKGGQVLKIPARGKITVLSQPEAWRSKHDDTIVRLGPGAARTTPLPAGVRFLSDGRRGESRRLSLADGKHVWILEQDLEPDPDSGQPPDSKVTTINLGSDSYGAWVRIPLSQRLPFRIEQNINPSRLALSIFAATADTDFVTPETVEPKDAQSAALIDFVTWRQKSDGHYEAVIHLKEKRQWGFYADYDGTDLVLHIKAPPRLSDDSLRGLTICVDPGHGGKEPGSVGCSGIPEKDVNLAMSMKLKEALEAAGAKVIMTRTSDADVSLAERVKIAVDSRADLLVSVHNNALPDGADPWKEHGTSSYWYHPQSIELARRLRESLISSIGLPDYGTRYQNLFLCRPSQMPAALVEVGFMIHPDEYALLIDPSFQEKVATGITNGVKAYMTTP